MMKKVIYTVDCEISSDRRVVEAEKADIRDEFLKVGPIPEDDLPNSDHKMDIADYEEA